MSYEPMRWCNFCDQRKYEYAFRGGRCEDCHVQYRREWRSSDHGKAVVRRLNVRAQRDRRAMVLLSAAKNRARKRGVPFAVSPEERERLQAIIDAGVCQLSGLPFNMEVGVAFYVDSPSIDRIEPALGYTDGNLRVILYGLNAAIGSWGYAKLLLMVRACENR